ncbi:hypothetical protein KY359_06870 [Candidatus Woesearchaeota archaeon]|nr:hypothetical protein [Candidatus Woesearchaeota archaeon]
MAADKDLEEIRKLPPKERLQRMKELEEKRKRQEAEAKKIIEESLSELKLDEMLQEIEVPKQEKVDIDRLFEQVGDIEEQLEAAKAGKGKGGTDYARRIQELLPDNTMQEIQQWYARDNVAPNRDEFLQVYEHAREAYETLQQSMQAAPNQELYSSPSEELVENVVSSMRLLRSMGYKMKWFDTERGA